MPETNRRLFTDLLTPIVRHRGPRLSLCWAALFWMPAGWSQMAQEETQSPPVMPDILVIGRRAEGLPLASSPNLQTPHGVSQDAAQLLQNTPGVSLYGAGGISSLPAIHGMADDRLSIQVDGMSLSAACPNHMNPPLSYLDPSQVGKIKVYSGIAPVSAGGDNIGGVIDVESEAAVFAEPGQTLTTGHAGTFYRDNGEGRGAHLSATLASERLSLTYSGATSKANDYSAARGYKAAGPAAEGRHWLAADTVGSSAYKNEIQSLMLAWRQANQLLEFKVGHQYVPFEGFPNQRMDMTLNRDTQANLHYLANYSWGDLDARVYRQWTYHEMQFGRDRQYNYGIAPGMPMNTRARNTGARVKGIINLSDDQQLTLGGEYQHYRLDDWWPPSPSVLPAGYTFAGMAPNNFLNINKGQRDRLALYGQWDVTWNERWSSQLGARQERVMTDTAGVHGYNTNYDGASMANPVSRFNSLSRRRVDYNWNLTALLRFTPSAQQTYDLGYAMKTRSPNLYERYAWSTSSMAMEMNNFLGDGNLYVGNPKLNPETAHTLSFTADWHAATPQPDWRVRLTPYLTYVNDYIDARRCPQGVCGDNAAIRDNLNARNGFVSLQFVNQPARLYGLDVSAHRTLAENTALGDFALDGLVNYARGKNRRTGDELYNMMPLNGKLTLSHKLDRWSNALEMQSVTAKDQLSRVRNEVGTSGYTLFHWRTAYQWKRVRLEAGVENLANRFYRQPLGGAYLGQGATMMSDGQPWGVVVPGMGRSVYTALDLAF